MAAYRLVAVLMDKNIEVESAIANLKAAQEALSKLFGGISTDGYNIFDISDENWEYDGHGKLTYGIEPDCCEFSHDGAEELEVQFITEAAGDYVLAYATEDTYNARVNRRYDNMSYYIINKNKEIK